MNKEYSLCTKNKPCLDCCCWLSSFVCLVKIWTSIEVAWYTFPFSVKYLKKLIAKKASTHIRNRYVFLFKQYFKNFSICLNTCFIFVTISSGCGLTTNRIFLFRFSLSFRLLHMPLYLLISTSFLAAYSFLNDFLPFLLHLSS